MSPSPEERLSAIEQRNARVEADKAWETSMTRRGFIALMTYTATAITLIFINMPHPWVSAVIPVVGYALSTLTLPVLRQLWHKRHHTSLPHAEKE